MKYIILSGLSSLTILGTIVSSVTAQTTVENPIVLNTDFSYSLTPRNLVSIARRGYFKKQDIPSYSSFDAARRSGFINAEKLVQIAIDRNRLSETALTDQNYLEAVKNHLHTGGCGSL